MTALIDRRRLLSVGGAVALSSPEALFARKSPTSPGHLNAYSAAYSPGTRTTFIFGGADDRRVSNRLWALHSGRWRLLSAAGPLPRTFAACAFDTSRGRLVVFGGNRVLFGNDSERAVLSDHWEWDGRSWTGFADRVPPGRTEAAMAFDPVRRTMVLFGGWRWEADARIRLGDLWEFDGRSWIEKSVAGPEPRSGAVMAWDPIGRRVLMGGGNGPRKDFWSWDGDGWARLADLPQARFNAAFAFDHSRRQAVLFGGWTGSERIAATAIFDGTGWTQLSATEPPARNHSQLVPTGDGSQLLLLGGHDGEQVFGDQWAWAGRWRPLLKLAPTHRSENNH